jgi:wyosine [tRNA(Phe)-imidazoG37] synthetase (radical SAM superfamily)
MKTIFGPVPSRRLGRSLGIDVVPLKTCSYDCVYCESGRTTHLTVERRPFVDPGKVMRELEEYFTACPDGADVLTFSSGGEPTLYEPLGELIDAVKNRFPSMPLIVLTNGSLLWDPRVRRDLMRADRVVPSLDGATVESFARVNRPHPMLDLDTIMEGLAAFRREYRGELHLEVMLVASYNDQPSHLKAIRRVIDALAPSQVELNTVVRPPADPEVRGLSGEAMEAILEYFPTERTQIIGKFTSPCVCTESRDLDRRVLELLKRRPCTLPEMAVSLGVPKEVLNDTLTELTRQGRLTRYRFDGKDFYKFAS